MCCSAPGDVYTWGDNDEGQLGDGSTNAIQVCWIKIEHQYLNIKRFPMPFLSVVTFSSDVIETTFSDVTARQEDQPCGVRVSSHTGLVNQ